MNQSHSEPSNLPQMVDIFSVLPSASTSSDCWSFIVIGAGLSILLIIVLIRLNSPLIKLERYLKQGKISPRIAAHYLAQLIRSDNKKINKQLDQLRFQRQSPRSSDLMNLIDRLKHDR